jgi:ribosome maturation factor RimP
VNRKWAIRPLFFLTGDLLNGMALTIEHLHSMLEPGAEALGLELVAVEMAGRDSNILRVYINSPDGISIDNCAAASRQFSAILDVEDPIAGKFNLEVSSPGSDRPLVKEAHFQEVLGETVKIRTKWPIQGRRRFTGVLTDFTDDAALVDVDGEVYELPCEDMERARLVPR